LTMLGLAMYQMTQSELIFDGADYDHERDSQRLTGQLLRVKEAINDGRWYTLKQLSEITGDPEASVSAQLRNLRKPRFGAYTINKRYIKAGLYEYALQKDY